MRKVLLIFGKLSDADVEWFARAGRQLNIGADQSVVQADSQIDSLFFVLDGELRVRTRTGKELARLQSGEVVGELSFVDPSPVRVNVTTVRATRLLAIPFAELRAEMKSNIGFCARFYQALTVIMADRIRQTSNLFDEPGEPASRDELNDDLLDDVHLAAARFDTILLRRAN